jgi:hypothetical protein
MDKIPNFQILSIINLNCRSEADDGKFISVGT